MVFQGETCVTTIYNKMYVWICMNTYPEYVCIAIKEGFI